MIQETQSEYLKVQACVFTWFPNKSVCIYDNKHASKQISWIDEFQNEKGYSFIFSYHHVISLPGGLVTLVIKRSLDQFADVGSSLGHKNDML